MRTLNLTIFDFNDNKQLGDGPYQGVTITGNGGYELIRYLDLWMDKAPSKSIAFQVDSETVTPVNANALITIGSTGITSGKYVQIGGVRLTAGTDFTAAQATSTGATALAAAFNANTTFTKFATAVAGVNAAGATVSAGVLIRSKLPGALGNYISVTTDDSQGATTLTIKDGMAGSSVNALTNGAGVIGTNTINAGLPIYQETFACAGVSSAYTLTNVPVAIISMARPGMCVTGTNIAENNYITQIDEGSRTLTLNAVHAGTVTAATINNGRLFGVT